MSVFDPAPETQSPPPGTAVGSGAAASDSSERVGPDAGDAAVHDAAPRSAEPRADHARMLAWEGQLRSIQQLGQRLATLTTVQEIGQAICNEIRLLVRSHNVRVYRVHGEDCVAVAWRGEIGEYADEVGEELSVRVGQGITGWVAQHGVSQ